LSGFFHSLDFCSTFDQAKVEGKKQIKLQQFNIHLNLAKIQKHKVKLIKYQSVCNLPMAAGFITA